MLNLPVQYKYRNLPCNVVPSENLWYVSGRDWRMQSSGVLEWCVSKEDAKNMLSIMLNYNQFRDLKIGKESKR